MTIEKRRIIGRAIVSKRYYSLLKSLTSNVSIEDNLVSLEFSDDIIEGSETGNLLHFGTYPFGDKTNIRNDILKFVDCNKDFYLWTEDSYYCGLLHLPNLQSFNFDCRCEEDENGVVIFFYPTIQILIDYYEEADGLYLDLKIHQLIPISSGIVFQ